MIYVIERAGTLLVKIGYTRNRRTLRRRLETLRTSCADRLDIVDTFEGTIQQEKALHALLAPAKVRGEWYVLSTETDGTVDHAIKLAKAHGIALVLGHTYENLRHFMPCGVPTEDTNYGALGPA